MVIVAALDVMEVLETDEPSPTAAIWSVPPRPTMGTWRALEPVPFMEGKPMKAGFL